MPSVWYIGNADERAVPFGDQIFVWRDSNGWSLDESVFTNEQLNTLDADPSFLLGQNGPRENPPWTADTSIGRESVYLKQIKGIVDSFGQVKGRRLHAALSRAYAGTGVCDILNIGDSVSTPYTGASFDFPRSWHRMFKESLIFSGYFDGGTGIVPCLQGNAQAIDDRITLSGTWNTNNVAYLQAGPGSPILDFYPNMETSRIEVHYSNAGAGFEVEVTGQGEAESVVPDGSPTLGVYARTVPNGDHEVQVTAQEGAIIFNVAAKASSGIRFHNMGKYGMTAQGFLANHNFVRTVVESSMPNPDALILSCGANDLTNGRSPAQIVQDLGTIAGMCPTSDLVVCVEPQTTTEVADAVWESLHQRLIAFARSRGAILVDWHDMFGGRQLINQLGYVGADNKHPNATAQAAMAAQFKSSIGLLL
ncbi:hydrolase [Gordonia phage Suzy]|uniref:Hydrolase n=1 Tax=Gordonia phage Suzy TaxID=2201430 RepID=A0A2Z4Q8K0_9CAUD|nr:hydrolase [Gordonia phage Suzy]AWY06109.1 hydrolase [Gordonia phage Suzy]